MASGRGRGKPRPRRPKGPPKHQLRLFVEGEKTEIGYFTRWRSELRATVVISLSEYTGVDPRALVERATEEKRIETREAKRGRGEAHDEYWCVFDADTHARLPEALDMARANGVHVALSVPCFELWLVLHAQEHTAHLESRAAQRLCSELLGCGKALPPRTLDHLLAQYGVAADRARALESRHVNNGDPPTSNPSSGVWRLVDAMRAPQR
jgi:hypothetical protein